MKSDKINNIGFNNQVIELKPMLSILLLWTHQLSVGSQTIIKKW